MSWTSFPRIRAIACCVGSLIAAMAADSPPAVELEPPLALPPFVVYGAPDGLPWQYARYRDFEVLTLCPPDVTRAFIEAEWRGRHLLPDQFEQERSETSVAVLYDLSAMGQSGAAPGITWEKDAATEFGSGWRSLYGVLGYGFEEGDEDELMAANLSGLDSLPALHAAHLSQLLSEYRPAIPAWVRAAFFSSMGVYYGLGSYGENEPRLRTKKFTWIDESASRAVRISRHPEAEFLPLGELFTSQPPPAGEAGRRRKWEDQLGLFARWQLLGDDRAKAGGNEGFWQLVYLSCSGVPVTEDLFKQCLGWSYAEAAERMGKYLRQAVQGPDDIAMKKFPPVGIITLQPASEAQIARLKGNFERLEAKRLRPNNAALAAAYEAAARRTLRRGLERSGNDPAVRAILGRLEIDCGHPDAARPHLEAAFMAKAADARALLALVRLRLAEALRSDGRVPPDRLAAVFAPLTVARERKPALRETYELVADIWQHSAARPERGHLAVLVEGVKLFPHDLDLLLRACAVHHQYGFDAEAAVIAALGVQRSDTAARREAFQRYAALASPGPRP